MPMPMRIMPMRMLYGYSMAELEGHPGEGSIGHPIYVSPTSHLDVGVLVIHDFKFPSRAS